MRGSRRQPMTFDRFRILSEANLFACVNFLENWERLAAQGVCDAPRGAEFERIFQEFLRAGKPMSVGEFIRERANMPAPPLPAPLINPEDLIV
jgi:hypothetical protein